MQQSSYNKEIRKVIANSIPCIHMNTLAISERVLKATENYLLDLKSKGILTIDDLINEMRKTDEQ